MKYTLKVVTRLNDNGDGGYTMYVFNNQEEMLADIEQKRRKTLSVVEKREILTEDDPYKNGYLGSDTIEIEIIDGQARLTEKLSFSVGQ